MASKEELVVIVVLYITLCVAFSLIYAFTGHVQMPVDFLLFMNATRYEPKNFSVS